MENINLCKEFEEVREQISRVVDEAIKRLYEARDRLAKVIVVNAGLIESGTDKYGALVTYMDLMSLIQALSSGEITISVDIGRVLDNLGCKAKSEKL